MNVHMIIKFTFIFHHVYLLKHFLVRPIAISLREGNPLFRFRSSIDLCRYLERRSSYLFRYSDYFFHSSKQQSICLFCNSDRIFVSHFSFSSSFQRYSIASNSSSVISLHMARDDSCHDLYSRQMSTVMSLSSKVFNTSSHHLINQSCRFPLQFQSDQWYSINHTIRMMITGSNMELFDINKRFHCQEIITSEQSTHLYRIRTYNHW